MRVTFISSHGTPEEPHGKKVVAEFEYPCHLHSGDYVHITGGRYKVCQIHYVATDDEVQRIYKMICYVKYEGPSDL